MFISTKGRYALRIMTELAEREQGIYTTLPDIAKKQGISEKYLESIISVLSKAKLVEGVRGKGGGYRLSRTPDKYTVGEILRLTEKGGIAPVSCLECKPNKCARAVECRTLPLWENLNTIISNYLDNVTIADLVNPSEKGNYEI